MKHGLMFGGFNVISSSGAYSGDYKNLLSDSPEWYRGFGNHRIATYLRRCGWDIEVLDYFAYFTLDELKQYVDERITKETVFVGLSVIFFTFKTQITNKLMSYIKKKYPWVTIVSGGPKRQNTFIVDADYYISGNGEYALESVLKYVMGNGEKPKYTLLNDKKHIDAFKDYPCYPKRDANISYQERDYIQPYETLNVEFSRGCMFKCRYCSFPLIGMTKDTTRHDESVYQELLENYEKWGVTSYYVTDETVNDSKNKMKKIADVVRRLPFRPQFNGYARADLLIRHGKETWDDMIDMGFTSHSYGVESFNHESVKVMGKGMKPEEMKEGLLKIEDYFTEHSHQYYAGTVTMIAGLPYETWESLDSTKEWLNKYWSNHSIQYLALILKKDTEVKDNRDDEITDTFNNYGYKFLKADETFSDNHMIQKLILEAMSDDKFEVSGSIWEHPSGDYDWVDMTMWCWEFIGGRQINGMNSLNAFQSSHAWFDEYKTPENMKNYFKRDAWSFNMRSFYDFINNYKKQKISSKKKEI